jgi:hypothetical protein
MGIKTILEEIVTSSVDRDLSYTLLGVNAKIKAWQGAMRYHLADN